MPSGSNGRTRLLWRLHERAPGLLAAAAMYLLVASNAAAQPGDFARVVEPFLQKHCLGCHGAQKQKGDLRLDTLAQDFSDESATRIWDEVIFRINTGEMPPETEPRPSAEELSGVVEWLSGRLREGQAARMARRGPVAHYRLSRSEYQNTIYDLLGVYYDVDRPGVFNQDPLWHGFDRIGSMMTLSPSHVDHYFRAAEQILDSADLGRAVKVKTVRRQAVDLRRFDDGELEQIRAKLKALGRDEPMRYLVWPGGRLPAFTSAWLTREGSGLYRARMQLSGLPGLNGDRPHVTVRGGSRGATRTVFDADVVSPADKPIVLEFETYMEMPASLTLVNESAGVFDPKKRGVTALGHSSVLGLYQEPSLMNPTAIKLFTEDGRAIYPLLIVDWIEWEGPIISDAMQRKRTELHPGKASGDAEVRKCLKTLARRAWRRPVTDAEIDPYMKLMTSELAAGEKFDAAYKSAMIAVLTSSNFYYLREGSADQERSTLNDWELASRLSYFLYNSMPDDELFVAAESGTLHEPPALRQQLARMFDDPKFGRFLDAFPYQWLQLHRVGMFQPNPDLYPQYSPWLERSMVAETVQYFRQMFVQNRPLREFLHSDWTVVNSRLREHYGMQPTNASGFERITLGPDDHRGGVLTQAAILSLTSDGQRHRPVHRGVWLSEAIFNRTPPAPPPNVEPLEPAADNAPKATIRMQLQSHAANATCASCHKNIDPLGFAFENYDAIGRWRTVEQGPGKGQDPLVNAAGTLPDGRAFDGPDRFKALLVEEEDRVAVAFTEQLATYALRRVLTIDDADQIRAIVQASRKDDYRLRTLIENFVLSELFRKR